MADCRNQHGLHEVKGTRPLNGVKTYFVIHRSETLCRQRRAPPQGVQTNGRSAGYLPYVYTECRVDGQVQTESLLTLELLRTLERIFLSVWRDAPGC